MSEDDDRLDRISKDAREAYRRGRLDQLRAHTRTVPLLIDEIKNERESSRAMLTRLAKIHKPDPRCGGERCEDDDQLWPCRTAIYVLGEAP